uniref:Major facilitator superfamily domain containing 2ab n=1 Tax=Gasterosteus aculeatus TaxID=69293 RepID=G3P0X2_GASAC
MAKGEGGEQYSNASLLEKPVGADGIALSRKHEQANKLSVCNKLCYAIGGAPYQITGTALGFFLQIYLLDVAQVSRWIPFYASIILFVGRAWDAVTDPTVGFLVSRSPWTRFGRMLPWFWVFYVFKSGGCREKECLWSPEFLRKNVFGVFMSLFLCPSFPNQCFHVPYSALTMFISSEQKERDSATAYRMTVEVLGTVLGTAVQGQIVGMANAPCLPGPFDIVANASNSSLSAGLNASPRREAPYMIAFGVIFHHLTSVVAIILFLGVKEEE